jgi:HNH endonuclease
VGRIEHARGAILFDDLLTPILTNFVWSISSHGYGYTNIGSKKILMHRFIMGAKAEDTVDHINGNKLDNRCENLRFVSKGQNAQNTRKAPSSTGFIGVSYDKKGYIKAGIKYHGRRRHLGMFTDLISAAIAYDKAAVKLFGPDARTNIKHFQEIVVALSEWQRNLKPASKRKS